MLPPDYSYNQMSGTAKDTGNHAVLAMMRNTEAKHVTIDVPKNDILDVFKIAAVVPEHMADVGIQGVEIISDPGVEETIDKTMDDLSGITETKPSIVTKTILTAPDVVAHALIHSQGLVVSGSEAGANTHTFMGNEIVLLLGTDGARKLLGLGNHDMFLCEKHAIQAYLIQGMSMSCLHTKILSY